jgi:hypothetical protein
MTHLRNQQTNSASDSPYYSQHDSAVVERLNNMARNQGVGEEIYYPDDDDVGTILSDFGLSNMQPKD